MILIDFSRNLANVMKPVSRKMHTYPTIVFKASGQVKSPVGEVDLSSV